MTMLDHALSLVDMGFAVFPLAPNDKVPATGNGYKDATHDLDHIRYWWRKSPNANIGIATGPKSGCWVVDVDRKPGVDGYESVRLLQEQHGAIGSGYMVSTPTGGLHIYYRWNGREVRNSTNRIAPGVDQRGDGGYVVAAGSVRSCGEYVAISEGEMVYAPEWLVDIAAPIEERRVVVPPPPIADVRGEAEKARKLLDQLAAWRADDYDAWVRVGMALHRLGGEGLSLWESWSSRSEKYKQGVCERKWKSFDDNGVSLATLVYMAQQDNPQQSQRKVYRTDYANIIANGY